MDVCPDCKRMMFVFCHVSGHGSWCFLCTRALTCPRCASAESVLVDLLVDGNMLTGLLCGSVLGLALWAAVAAAVHAVAG